MKKVDGILSADWHLREASPSCRTDNFQQAQRRKLLYLKKLQKLHDCPIYVAGDVFDKWNPSLAFLSELVDCMPFIHTICGNHDLPQHSILLRHKSALHLLEKTGHLSILSTGVHWNHVPTPDTGVMIGGRRMLIWHTMTYQGKKPYPGCTDPPSIGILKKYKDYDIILTGHNHQTFTVSDKNRLLLNPGCITRQESDMADFLPAVYFYHAKDNTITRHQLPHTGGVVSKSEKVQEVEERNDRIDAFVSKLRSDFDTDINFEVNLERHFSKNKTAKKTQDIIYSCIQDTE